MSALIAVFGAKALVWAAGALALLLGGIATLWSAKSSGAATQRATDAQKEKNDDIAAAQARAGVDGLGDAAVDKRLHDFQRK